MELAYIPIEKVTKKDVTEITIPPYPDNGVSYGGNSKTLKGGNSYQVNSQTPFTCSYALDSFSGTSLLYLGVPAVGKKLYIRSIQLGTSISAVDVNSSFKILDNHPTRTLFEVTLLRSETLNFYFDVPLMITDGVPAGSIIGYGCSFSLASGAATLNKCSVNIQGWVE